MHVSGPAVYRRPNDLIPTEGPEPYQASHSFIASLPLCPQKKISCFCFCAETILNRGKSTLADTGPQSSRVVPFLPEITSKDTKLHKQWQSVMGNLFNRFAMRINVSSSLCKWKGGILEPPRLKFDLETLRPGNRRPVRNRRKSPCASSMTRSVVPRGESILDGPTTSRPWYPVSRFRSSFRQAFTWKPEAGSPPPNGNRCALSSTYSAARYHGHTSCQ